MNTTLLCLTVLTAASPAAAPQTTQYRPLQQFETAMRQDDVPPVVVRAQSPTFFGGATQYGGPTQYGTLPYFGNATAYYGADAATPPTFAPAGGPLALASAEVTLAAQTAPGALDSYGNTVPPTFQPYQDPFGAGSSGDPWIAGGAGTPVPNVNPFGSLNAQRYTFGFNGAQPYRYGWSARYDVGILANEGTTGAFSGGWGITEVNTEKELVMPIWNNWVFAMAPQFNYRAWDGPSFGGGLPGLHGSMFRFGLGLKLATPDYGGWNAEVGFNPGFASDLYNTDTSDAMQWDAHAVLFWRATPQWMIALGAAYWDRVDDIVIPQAGAVWTPNDIWEFRLVFPKPRISMFMGTPFGVPTWAYVRGEYHVESYAVEIEPTVNAKLKIQVEDWRALGGIRTENGAISTFAEVGWVFERDSKFDVPGLNSQIHSGLIGRVGLRY